jgi:hypothetical protein
VDGEEHLSAGAMKERKLALIAKGRLKELFVERGCVSS